MRCLTSARYTILVDIRAQVSRQDPDSGEVRKIWVTVKEGVPCGFHGILQGGIRVAGTTERFGAIYESVDWAKMDFGPDEPINKQSQITNVRDLQGNIIWREEEVAGSPPTVFDVQGVTPILNGFGRHTESTALLERHEIQG
jgi:hypothetical protein